MKQPNSGHHKHHSTVQATKSDADTRTGCMVVGGIAFLIFLISQCSSKTPSSETASAVSSAPQAIATAIATLSIPPVEALNPTNVRKGVSDLKKAAREGLAGQMIYSQNCYDALSRQFTWSKLDACGAFDAGASLAVGDDTAIGSEKETAWFQSEAAAGRYLKAASSAGENPEGADNRLDELQAHVAKSHPVVLQSSSAPTDFATGAAAALSSDSTTSTEPMDAE